MPPFRQVVGVQNGRSVLQLLPAKPTAQVQLISGPNPSTQVPPFRQVVGVQSLMSLEQVGPSKPGAHVQLG